MAKAKKLMMAIVTTLLMGSLAGCIWVDRGGYYGNGDYCRYHYCR
jgi:hypothetical protein